MTGIAAVINENSVWIGGDSVAGGEGYSELTSTPKVFINGSLIIGYTSSFRMGQLLQYELKVEEPSEDLDKWMNTYFIDEIITLFKNKDFNSKNSERSYGGNFIVGIRNNLFIVDDDYHVRRPLHDFAAVGSGAEVIQGSLYSTKHMKPRDRITLALEAAEHFNPYVRGPFTIKKGS